MFTDAAQDGSPAGIIAQLADFDVQRLADDSHARMTALALARKLSASLEEPEAYAMATALAPISNLAVRLAIDINLFSLLAAQSGPVSTAFVASAAHCDATLANRLLRTCGALSLVQQHHIDVGDAWSANENTRAMAVPAMAAWHRMLWDMSMTAAIAAPPFLRDSGHRALTDPSRGIFQRAFPSDSGAPRSPYEVLKGMPALHRDFNESMAVGTGQPEPWFQLFPASERLLPTAPKDGTTPLLVDVAGGRGHDLQAFHDAFPGHGPLVLQDLPEVIDAILAGALDSSITVQKYDFFAEGSQQSVKGARAYLLRRVLHQWPDGHALRILRALRDAMLPEGQSTLLVCDAVLPDVGAPRAQCELDLCVMVFSGGLERSRSQWVALLTEAGFEVVKIWQTHQDTDGIIEAVVGSS